MILHTLRLRSFRAHAETELTLAPAVNLLYGPNGVGKTNVLEAIHYLCLTKSFTASRDRYAVRKEAPYFEIEGTFEGVRQKPMDVRLAYVPGEGKSMFVNGAELDRLADIVGVLPVVIFSPEDYDLTAGGPSERRRFVNNILSQARPVYMDDLLKYRRARRQRNEVLRSYKKRPDPPPTELIDPWTEELVTLGSRVIRRRQQFLQDFAEYLTAAYERIEAVAERPSIEYDTIGDLPPDASVEDVEAIFRTALDDKKHSERDRGTTLVGPQRDELIFRLDDLEVRRYGSQGQHRTFAMALKLAQYFYLDDRSDTTRS
jgi:DNA replication and repair protein RecF